VPAPRRRAVFGVACGYMGRRVRRTAYVGIWVLNLGLLIAAVDNWGGWGFLVAAAFPFTWWIMRRIDSETWAKEQEDDSSNWWG
jgi:hypothetical protein